MEMLALRWHPPLTRVLKINADGSVLSNLGSLAIDGIKLRITQRWIYGLSANIGYGRILMGELWGLGWGSRKPSPVVTLMSNLAAFSSVVMKILNNSTSAHNSYGALASTCHQLMKS